MSSNDPEPPQVIVVDLSDSLADAGDGVHWKLRGHGDLNANLVRLDAGHALEEHVNYQVDLLVIVIAGDGSIRTEGAPSPLRPHVVAHVPRGRSRSIVAGPNGLSYLTVHRRRTLNVGTKPGRGDRR